MLPTKLLLRLARHLATACANRTGREGWTEWAALNQLAESHQTLLGCRHRLELARQRDLRLAAALLERELPGRVQAVREAADQARSGLERSRAALLRLTDWLSELRQLEAEFGEVTVDWEAKTLSITTAPITLRDVYLGPFSVRLHWDHRAERSARPCFTAVALDPHPAAPNEDVTHPHVKHDILCTGDATLPLRQALDQGRIADAFCLVRAVLQHYNPGSPYVALEDWSGTECHDCGCQVPEDEHSFCEGCDHDYCCDCTASCSICDNCRCRGCLEYCAVCDTSCCAACLQSSAHSGRECCRHCLVACAGCSAEVASDELDVVSSCCPTCQQSLTPTIIRPDRQSEVPVLTTPDQEPTHDRPEDVPQPA